MCVEDLFSQIQSHFRIMYNHTWDESIDAAMKTAEQVRMRNQ